ncbi:MAG: hypothetical protein FWG25_11025 [Promicromonosporaceae bacterium]|nr:hypothetical protein [Promicromonosporaceae bacterium]
MAVQIATRFPDEIAEKMTQTVAAGWAPNRSALIQRAVERELRRAAAARDYQILLAHPTDPDLDSLTEWTMSQLHGTDLDA